MASKKKIDKKKSSFRNENEERPRNKRVKVEKVKYRNMNTWLKAELD